MEIENSHRNEWGERGIKFEVQYESGKKIIEFDTSGPSPSFSDFRDIIEKEFPGVSFERLNILANNLTVREKQ